MHDFSNAAPQQDFGTIPDGTLAFGILNIRPSNGNMVTQSKATEGSAYLDIEVTVSEGPFARRKIWEKIGVAGSEKWINMGRSAIRSILEVGRGASQSNMAGYQIADYAALNGLTVAMEIGIEKEAGYDDKNRIKAFLTPNPESSTSKKFAKLLEMKQAGYSGQSAAPAKAPAASAPAWGAPAAGATQAPAQATPATNKPAWL